MFATSANQVALPCQTTVRSISVVMSGQRGCTRLCVADGGRSYICLLLFCMSPSAQARGAERHSTRHETMHMPAQRRHRRAPARPRRRRNPTTPHSKKKHARLKPSHQQSQGQDRKSSIRLALTARTQSGGFTAQGRRRRRALAPSASAPSGRCPRPPTRGPAAWRAPKSTARAGVPAPQPPPSGPPRSCTC